MPAITKAKGAVEWYSKTRVLYEALAKKVESIIKEILESKKINYHSITSRAKSISRYEEKASKEKYKEPRSEILDMAGIRIITYTDSDVHRVHDIIKESFELLPEHSIDKSKELGIDKVGYRSIHCICKLGNERVELPENKIFKGRVFEIQIRTILQHAWAEFEHDRNYKFRGVLPPDIQRRLSILAGTLELIDKEFEQISETIDAYSADVGKKTETGDLSIPINSTSLMTYMTKKFEPLVEKGINPDFGGADEVLIEELRIMEIDTLEKLEKIIPKDFIKTKSENIIDGENFLGIIRDILIVHDADTYFSKAWKESWNGLTATDVHFFKKYVGDFDKYFEKYGIDYLGNVP